MRTLQLGRTPSCGHVGRITYHPSGRLATRTWARGGGLVTTCAYNAFGDLAAIDYPDATPDVSISTRDRLGRPLAVVQAGIGTETITYHPGRHARDRTYYDASHALLPGIGLRHAPPDPHGRPAGFDETSGTDTQVLRTATYAYNDRSEIAGATRRDPTGAVIPALGSTFAFDGIGNRLTSTSPALGDRTFTPDQLNRYASIATQTSGVRAITATPHPS